MSSCGVRLDRGNKTWHSLQVCLLSSAIELHVQHHKPTVKLSSVQYTMFISIMLLCLFLVMCVSQNSIVWLGMHQDELISVGRVLLSALQVETSR